MRVLILTFFILISLVSCNNINFDGYTNYTIREGKHRSTIKIDFLKKDILSFKVKFDESVKYHTKDPINQFDINKLYGFSDCSDNHQKNSARFGWRWLDNKIQIFYYVYRNGDRVYGKLGSVNINEVNEYHIMLTDSTYIFGLNGKNFNVNRGVKCNIGLYYKLYPYFGGDETAPHDIKILIKEIQT